MTAHEIRLTNGVVIAVHTNSFRLIRGHTLLACIFDEVAYLASTKRANPDLETYRAVRPSLARTGGMLIGISSPYRRAGLLYARYKDYYDADDDACPRRSRCHTVRSTRPSPQPSSPRRWPPTPRRLAPSGVPNFGPTSRRCWTSRSSKTPSTMPARWSCPRVTAGATSPSPMPLPVGTMPSPSASVIVRVRNGSVTLSGAAGSV